MLDVAPQPLERARAAFAKHSWQEAYDRFVEADAAASLDPADVESYAEASWWSGRPDASLGLLERAYGTYVDRGEPRRAARVAFRLVNDNASRGASAVATAWLARAERLLEHDRDSVEYGWLRLMHGVIAGNGGDPASAAVEARTALSFAQRFADRDLQALALILEGQALITQGQVNEGLVLVDEATVAAVSGELGLMATGIVYCSTIGACRDLADYRRAGEWTEAALRWCERQSVNGFPGICRVHRADILALRGALGRAEQEARLAHDELAKWDLRAFLGDSFYEIGFIRLRMGDLPAAAEAFREAHAAGRDPEPGLALVQLAEGKATQANAALRRALGSETSRPGRIRLLPARVEVAIAAGDLDAADEATAELEQLAKTFASAAVAAAARMCRGAVLLARGESERAEHELRAALALWLEIDAPYEAAGTRLLLARALREGGDAEAAALEVGAAKTTFERIGAARDARLAAAELGTDAEAPATAGPRVTRTFLFTDIVSSTDLIGLIGDEAWQDLIRWHDDTLRSLVAEHGGREIRHQGDGLVVSFDTPDRAIDCAVAIQRRLAEHRRTQGFAPSVRIGVHEAEVTERGLDYSGVGIHAAARIGAVASGGEIVSSRATVTAAKRAYEASTARSVRLKGIPEPVEVVSVAWR